MNLQDALGRWLFRFGRDDRLPVVLTQRRIFILPTRAGLLYGVVLCVMLIGAINYNLSLGHALVFLLAGLGLVAMVHTFRNLLGLRLMPGRADPVFAGEAAYFSLHLENALPLPRRALELAFGKNETASLEISGSQQVSVSIPFMTMHRGRLDPGRITLSSRYPLGLFRAWSYPHPPLSCLVYPKPLETPLPRSTPSWKSTGSRGNSGQEDFSGLRERQANDSPRHIAWKAVARDIEHRPLLVKQFDGGAAEELWLDWTQTPSGSDTETRLSLLAGWIVIAEREQRRYGLRLPERSIAPNRGAAHRDSCLEALALHA
ncbi:MAG: DUF58 domain-containing protein [Propionivibrio sp.]